MTASNIEKMKRADLNTLAETLTANVPALVVDWSPEAFTAETFTLDDLKERIDFVNRTDIGVSNVVMLGRAMIVWGAHFRDMVGDGKPFQDDAALGVALGLNTAGKPFSKGYVSKARRIGRAYGEYGVTPGSELWTRITKYDLPESVRKDLGKSPEQGADLQAIRDRWTAEIAAHLAPAPTPEPETPDGSEQGGTEQGASTDGPGTDIASHFKSLTALVVTCTAAGDRDSLTAILEGANNLSSVAMEALASVGAEPESEQASA